MKKTRIVKSPPVPQINFLDLIRAGTHFAETRGENIHIICKEDGRTVVVQPKRNLGATLVPVSMPDGHILWCEPEVPVEAFTQAEIPHSPLVVDLICQKIVEGGSLSRICMEPGFPKYATFSRWRRQHPYINEALGQARIDRAEYLRDQAMDEADKATSRDPVTASTLRVETLKWASGVDDPKYSAKAKVEASINMPTQIIVETGIRRGSDKND